jgi:hypothetical protein
MGNTGLVSGSSIVLTMHTYSTKQAPRYVCSATHFIYSTPRFKFIPGTRLVSFTAAVVVKEGKGERSETLYD